VRYRVIGARVWHYDLGSRRRQAQRFRLEAEPGGPVRFLRGSLQPASGPGGSLRWELSNVVTAQQIALAFPPDVAGRESYLQGLSALAPTLVLFLVGVLALGFTFHQMPEPLRLAAGLIVFAFGLGAAPVAAHYLGPLAGMILAPLAGAFLTARVLGRWSLLVALPAALLPATFLSLHHTGLLVLLLGTAALVTLLRATPGLRVAPREQIA
jgi:hypothetical protein